MKTSTRLIRLFVIWVVVIFAYLPVSSQYFDYEKAFVSYPASKGLEKVENADLTVFELPFEFPFGTQSYKKMRVFSKGWITFDENLNLKELNPPLKELNTLVAPYWYEKGKNTYFDVFVGKVSQDAYAIEWRDEQTAFRVVLHKNGNIEFFYNLKNWDDNIFVGLVNETSAAVNKYQNFFDGREILLLDVKFDRVNYFEFKPIKEPRNYFGKNIAHCKKPIPSVNLLDGAKATAYIGDGTSSTTSPTPYKGLWHDARMQIIVLASELSAAGLNANDIITGIGFNVEEVNSSQPYNGFTISMAHTTQSSFSTTAWITGVTWTTVYQEDYTPVVGWNEHNFTTNFSWNGTDNIVIEVCFDNSSYTSNDPVYYTSTSDNMVCYGYQDSDVGCSLDPDGTSTYRPNLEIIYTAGGPCTEPSDQPTNLTLSAVDPFTINGSFDAAASSPDGYLVVRSYSSSLTSDPVDGTYYNIGDALGGGTVVYRGSATSFVDSCLQPDKTAYYFIFAYDDYCSSAPDYNVNNPLTGNATTPIWGQPTNLNLTATTANSFDGSFTGNGSDGYLVVYSYSSSLTENPSDGTSYSEGDVFGNATVIQMSNSTSFSTTCLPTDKTYYVFVFAYHRDCSGSVIYNTNSPLTNSVTLNGGSADKNLPYVNKFDSDDGWIYEGVWERGDQTDDNYGPPSGVSGYSVAATKLNANYDQANLNDYLTTPTFALTGSTRPQISFYMDMESESYDGGLVEISVNGCDWIPIDYDDPGFSGLVPNDDNVSALGKGGWSGKVPDGDWDQVKIDLLGLTTPGLDNITTDDIIQVRFRFASDGSVSDYPGWYIDDFIIDDPDPCPVPSACPTDLHLTANGTSVSGIFTPANPEPTGYLVVRSTNSSLSELPQNGVLYNQGDALGGGTVVYQGPDFQFSDGGLATNTTYYYFIFAYNYEDCLGPTYLTDCYLTGSVTTGDCDSYGLPWTENFDGVEAPTLPDCWTIEDNSAPDDDWKTYSTSNARSQPNALYISYDYDNPLDDWAFSPGIQLNAGTNYVLIFYYRAGSSSWEENLEVKMGTNNNSASMTTLLWQREGFSNTTYEKVTISFSVSSSGVYYFGWHAYSDANKYGIYVEDINLFEEKAPVIYVVDDNYLFKDRGKRITVYGEGLSGLTVDFGGYSCTVVSEDGTQAQIDIPPGDYSNNVLTLTNSYGSATTTLTVKTRNIIPVKEGAEPTSDDHPTPKSAMDGLYAWMQTNTFDSTKIIEVYNGKYSSQVIVPNDLGTTSSNRLKIRAKLGEQPEIIGKDYAFKVLADYTDITGFSISYAAIAGIYIESSYDTISYNRVYKAEDAAIYVNGGKYIYAEHNLLYDNVNSGFKFVSADNIDLQSNTIIGNGHYSGGSGYTLIEDRPATGTVYDWEYSDTWTQIPFPDDDEYNIEMPFDFEFYGNKYLGGDSIAVSSNGFLFMEGDIYGPGTGVTNTLDYVNHPLYWHGANHSETKVLGNDYFIAPLYDDHYDDAHGGAVRYTVRGTAPNRRLIVVWYERDHWNYGDGTDDGVSFEVKLFESTNEIQFHYLDMSYGAPDSLNYCQSGTIGIKKNDSVYMEYCFNTYVDPSDVPFALEYDPSPAGGSGVDIVNSTNIRFENNIICAKEGDGSDVFYAVSASDPNSITYSDYNLYFANNNQYLLNLGGLKYTDLSSWPNAGANDIEADPMFVDPQNKDFHIKSDANGESFHGGEWPPLTAGSGQWVSDGEATPSPALDAGTGEYIWEQEDNGDARNIGCYGNTLQATKTAIVQGYWTGAVSTEWDNPNNWSDHIVPDKTKDAIIPDVSSTTNRFPYITIMASCLDLEIQPGAYVIIAPDGALTVEGVLKNLNGSDGLIIESDYTGDGSLIHNTTNVPAKVYRYFYGTRYHYISTPVDVKPVSDFNLNNFYYWDASMEWFGMGPPIDYRPWIVPDASSNLELFRGYAYYYYTDTLLFEGNLNVGSFTTTLHKYTGTLTQGGPEDQGWNLLGNPYAASINWDAVVADPSFPDPNTEVESALYLYDDYDASAEQKNYRYYVPADGTGGTYGVGTADATKYIPVGQGFFIRALQDGITFTIKAEHRAHSLQDYYKQEHHDNLVRLELAKDDYEDELVLRLIEPATEKFDSKYDARKLFVADMNLPQVCAINSDGTISAISSLPLTDQDIVVPLMVRCNEGDYTFVVKEQTLINGRRLYLKDNLQNKTIELKEGVSYEIHHSGGVDTNRFELIFTKNNAPIVEQSISDVLVYEDEVYTLELTNVFSDPDGDKLSYSLVEINSGTLPDWCNFSIAENTMILTFNPTNSDIGDYVFEMKATDPYGAEAVVDFNVKVINVNDAPYVVEQLSDYQINVEELFKVEIPKEVFADDDPNDNLTLSFDNLPAWLSSPEEGALVGTPTIDDVGEYSITVIATDNSGASAQQTFNITVLAPTQVADNSKVKISPNPTTALINIDVPENSYDVIITDMTGKVVKVEHFNASVAQMDLRDLASGSYRILIKGDNQIYMKQIVKQ